MTSVSLRALPDSVVGFQASNEPDRRAPAAARRTRRAHRRGLGGRVVVTANTASSDGGGIYNNSLALLETTTSSVVSGNTATASGGGISNQFEASATLTDTTLSTNTTPSTGVGGGLANAQGKVYLTRVTFSGNDAGDGGGLYFDGDHGWAGALLTVTGSTFDGNDALDGDGGGAKVIQTDADWTTTTVSNNTATGNGGGLYLEVDDTPLVQITLDEVEIHDNSATLNGGGAYWLLDAGTEAAGSMRHGAVYANDAVNGGGVYVNAEENGDMNFSYVTVSGNIATTGSGGGLYLKGGLDAVVDVLNSTIASNSAHLDGGGMYAEDSNAMARAIAYGVGNTILADNSALSDGADCFALAGTTYDTLGWNVVMDMCGVSNLVCPGFGSFKAVVGDRNTDNDALGGALGFCSTAPGLDDPGLGPLQDNGGGTMTHEIPPNGAVPTITDSLAPSGTCGPVDQRGLPAPGPTSTFCDIGAFERQ